MRVLTEAHLFLKLDANDWKIIREIRDNVRQPLTKIAQRCLLSRQSVEYRLKQMRQQQLLTGGRGVVNIAKLGYHSFHTFIEIHHPEQEKELIKRAEVADYVNLIISYKGKYNLEISIIGRSEEEFLQHYSELVRGIDIREDQTLILLDILCSKALPDQFLKVKPREENKISPPRKLKEIFLDKIDLKLLYLLSLDASKSNQSLARELRLSKDTLKYRLRRLEQNGYILEYRSAINYSSLGLSLNTLLIKLNYNFREGGLFENFLKSEPHLLWCAHSFGGYDYILYVLTNDNEEFHQVINDINSKFAEIIKTYEVLSAYEQLKYLYMSKNMANMKPL